MSNICSICFDDNNLIKTKCNHYFHLNCIKQIIYPKCPCCKSDLTIFLNNWSAHGKRLQCNATLLFSQYLIFSVDENIESASGCSIDSSVHFAKRMGSELGIDFFTRLEVLVIEGNETRLLSYFDAVAQKAPFINPQITQLSELRSIQF